MSTLEALAADADCDSVPGRHCVLVPDTLQLDLGRCLRRQNYGLKRPSLVVSSVDPYKDMRNGCPPSVRRVLNPLVAVNDFFARLHVRHAVRFV